MARTTVYNSIVTDVLWEKVNKQNKILLDDFIEYKHSTDRADSTVYQYEQQIKIFFVWNLENNDNKFFVDVKKRDIVRYFGYLQKELNSSPNRIVSMKASLSSLSNYIESICDDEYPNFRNIVKVVECATKQAVRKKTILTEEQIQECLDELVADKKYQVACFFALGVACGARKSELVRFKVDYFKDEYIIFDCLYETPEAIKTKGRGKRGKQLKKYTLKDMFKPYLDLWINERNEKSIENEYLFVVKNNGVYKQATDANATYWAQIIEKYLKVPFYVHATRHVWTTHCKKKNLPDSVIMELQGWSSRDMISIYDDTDIKDSFAKYFGKEGIKQVEESSVADL